MCLSVCCAHFNLQGNGSFVCLILAMGKNIKNRILYWQTCLFLGESGQSKALCLKGVSYFGGALIILGGVLSIFIAMSVIIFLVWTLLVDFFS